MPDVEGAKGKLKEAAGSVIGDKSMEREGDAQQDKAAAQEKASGAEERQEAHQDK